MEVISEKHCVIGEGPIWNQFERKLYFVDVFANEMCILDPLTKEQTVQKFDFGVSALGFSKKGETLICCPDGVFYLLQNGERIPITAPGEAMPLYCNDAKVGPDGRFYVGTQSKKRLGLGEIDDGKLYSIDKDGHVRILLDGLCLSNGFEWSIDEKLFYHTDSATGIIREYYFDIESGSITPTKRALAVPGVDGFTIGQDGCLYVSCWGQGHIAVVNTKSFDICRYIPVPTSIPASCCFMGDKLDMLAVVTASYKTDLLIDCLAGFTFVHEAGTVGRLPYLFG